MIPKYLVGPVERAVGMARIQAEAWGLTGPGQCLPLAALTTSYLFRQGLEAFMQAGTCYWPLEGPYDVPHTEPYGREPDPLGIRVFGFEWNPECPKTKALVAQGLAPEFHAWSIIPGPGVGQQRHDEAVIVDSGVREVFAYARRDGFKIDTQYGLPPDYFANTGDMLPHGVRYLGVYEACQWAIKMTIDMMGRFDTFKDKWSFSAFMAPLSQRREYEQRMPVALRLSA